MFYLVIASLPRLPCPDKKPSQPEMKFLVHSVCSPVLDFPDIPEFCPCLASLWSAESPVGALGHPAVLRSTRLLNKHQSYTSCGPGMMGVIRA